MLEFNERLHGEFLKRCKKVYKKEYQVEVVRPSRSVSVTNVLEGANYTTTANSVVIKGTVGELWVAPIDKVMKTYVNIDGRPLTERDFLADRKFRVKTKRGNFCYAMHVPANTMMKVNTAWGDVLLANREGIPHGNGDFVVCGEKNGRPDFSDVWVVNGKVFNSTYAVESKGTENRKVNVGFCNFRNEQFHSHITNITQIDNYLRAGKLDIMIELRGNRGNEEASEILYGVRGNKVIYVFGDVVLLERSRSDYYKTVKGLASALYNTTKRDSKIVENGEAYTIAGIAVGVNGDMLYSVEMY